MNWSKGERVDSTTRCPSDLDWNGAGIDAVRPDVSIARTLPVQLRPTREADLDFVLRLERDAENNPYVGQWSRDEHSAIVNAHGGTLEADPIVREHWIIEVEAPLDSEPRPVGYLIGYDLRRSAGGDRGMHIKRIVVSDKGRGIGREAVSLFCRHAFESRRATFVWLDVLSENLRAQSAYHAAGFEVHDTLTPEQRRDWSRDVGCLCHNDVVMIRRRASPG